jgi:hypothetical protein
VRVSRELVLLHETGCLHLEDRFEAAQAHSVITPFHMAPGVSIELHDGAARLHAQGHTFLLRWSGSQGWRTHTRTGRVSPSYGRVEPVEVLVFEADGLLQPLRLIVEVLR